MKAVLGFLDNLSYNDYDESLKKYHEKEINIKVNNPPYVYYKGPFERVSAFPKGGYLFKIIRNSDKETKPLVLESLGIDERLVLRYPGKEDIEIGIIAQESPENERPDGIGMWETNVRRFCSNISAFKRKRGEHGDEFTKPYFMIFDGNFRKMFPVNPDEDYNSFWTDCKPREVKTAPKNDDKKNRPSINSLRDRIKIRF